MAYENGDNVTPPYISWKTFMGFVEDCKDQGIPGRIDASVLTKLSGTYRSQLVTGLKSLNLIAGDGTPTQAFELLVDSYKTDKWKTELTDTIAAAYTPILGNFDPKTATPGLLRERFRTGGKIEGDTVEKATRFYLSALKEAGVPFSPRLEFRERAPRNAVGRRASKVKPVIEGSAVAAGETGAQIPPGTIEIRLDLLRLEGFLILPEEISVTQWERVNSYVKNLIELRTNEENKAEE
jgi:hypothetical protein